MSNRTVEQRTEFQIEFGAFAPTLRQQIIASGFTTKDVKASKNLTHCQIDADAVSRLSVRGIITQAAADSARKKIVKKIGTLIERQK
jgi:hypothetical protein